MDALSPHSPESLKHGKRPPPSKLLSQMNNVRRRPCPRPQSGRSSSFFVLMSLPAAAVPYLAPLCPSPPLPSPNLICRSGRQWSVCSACLVVREGNESDNVPRCRSSTGPLGSTDATQQRHYLPDPSPKPLLIHSTPWRPTSNPVGRTAVVCRARPMRSSMTAVMHRYGLCSRETGHGDLEKKALPPPLSGRGFCPSMPAYVDVTGQRGKCNRPLGETSPRPVGTARYQPWDPRRALTRRTPRGHVKAARWLGLACPRRYDP